MSSNHTSLSKLKKYLKYRRKSIKKYYLTFSKVSGINLTTIFILGIIIPKNILLIGLTVFIILLVFKTKSLLAIVIFLLSILFCFYWDDLIKKDLNNLISNNRDEVFTARIIEPIESYTFHNQTVIRVDGFNTNTILKTEKSDLKIGNKIIIQGNIKVISPNDYPEWFINYNHSKAIYSEITPTVLEVDKNPKDIIYITSEIKEQLNSKISKYLNNNSFNIFTGILYGNKANINKDLKVDLQKSGLTHIISASGFNVIFLFVLLTSLLKPINIKLIYILAILTIVSYVFIIGVYVLPAIRAAVMLIIIIIGKYLGRIPNILIALNVSIILILLQFPYYYKNISFQLSVLATIGLFILAPIITAKFINLPSVLKETLSSTTAITITTLPVIYLTFSEYPALSVISNAFALPLIPLIMILGFITIPFLILNVDFISSFLFYICDFFINIILFVANEIGSLTFSTINNTYLIVLIYLSLIFVVIYFDYKRYLHDKKT